MKVTVMSAGGVWVGDAELAGVNEDGIVQYRIDIPFIIEPGLTFSVDELPARSALVVESRMK